MFKIRKEVMQIYRDKRIGHSLTRFMQELKTKLADMVQQFSDDRLKQFCDQGASHAQQYGIKTEYNVYRFLAAKLFFGMNFDSDPKLEWTKDFLFDPLVDEDHKSRLLELRIAIDKGRGI